MKTRSSLLLGFGLAICALPRLAHATPVPPGSPNGAGQSQIGVLIPELSPEETNSSAGPIITLQIPVVPGHTVLIEPAQDVTVAGPEPLPGNALSSPWSDVIEFANGGNTAQLFSSVTPIFAANTTIGFHTLEGVDHFFGSNVDFTPESFDASGVLTEYDAANSFGTNIFLVQSTSAPEPATATLVGCGAVGLLARRPRKRIA